MVPAGAQGRLGKGEREDGEEEEAEREGEERLERARRQGGGGQLRPPAGRRGDGGHPADQPKVSAVPCANDQMALGALQSLDARHLTSKIKLVGFDGTLAATQQIVAKKMYATVAQDLYGMAEQGVEQAVRAIKHERGRKTINIGNPLVTQQNAEAYFKRVQKKLGG